MQHPSPTRLTAIALGLVAALPLGAAAGCGDTARAEHGGPTRLAAQQSQAPERPRPSARPAAPAVQPPAAPAVVPQAPSVRRVSISGTGDLLVHQRVAESARLHASEGGFDWSFRGLAEAIRPDEIAFVNLETPLTTEFRDPQSVQPPVLGAPAEVAPALAHAGVDVVGVANNHAYDQTARGLLQTLERVRAVGIVPVGAGHDEEEAYTPVVVERDGVRVAFIGITDRLNSSPERYDDTVRVARQQEEARVRAALAEARTRADIVVVALHWGEEWADGVGRRQRGIAEHLVELGADLILGTGPHVLLPVERIAAARGEAVVAYSLGNSISNQGLKYLPGHVPPGLEGLHEESPLPRDSLLLRVRFEVPEPGHVRVAAVEGVPLWTQNNWRHRIRERTEVVQIARLSTCDEAARTERWPIIARTIGPAVTLVP